MPSAEDVVRSGWRATASLDWVEHPDEAVRVLALGALRRAGKLTVGILEKASQDRSAVVRTRAAEIASEFTDDPACSEMLLRLLDDADPLVVDAAIWAFAKSFARRSIPVEEGIVRKLSAIATEHRDARCRETATAALGATRSDAALPALKKALQDRAPVRRRAAVALARLGGPEARKLLARLQYDRDSIIVQIARDALFGRPVF